MGGAAAGGPYHQGTGAGQQMSSKGFQQQHINQAANTSYMRNNVNAMGGGLQGQIPQQKSGGRMGNKWNERLINTFNIVEKEQFI